MASAIEQLLKCLRLRAALAKECADNSSCQMIESWVAAVEELVALKAANLGGPHPGFTGTSRTPVLDEIRRMPDGDQTDD